MGDVPFSLIPISEEQPPSGIGGGLFWFAVRDYFFGA